MIMRQHIKKFVTTPFIKTQMNYSKFSSFSNNNNQIPAIVLYQYAICPFCNMTKALLNYANVDYDVVEVNPLTKIELKPWSGEYRKVPIAKMNGKQINGSSNIIQNLLDDPFIAKKLERKWSTMSNKSSSFSMHSFSSSKDATKWTSFAKDELAALLYPNICNSVSNSYQAFAYVQHVDSFTSFQKSYIRTIGCLAMYIAASKIKSKRGIVDERDALRICLTKWEKDGLLGGNKEFSSGMNTPNLGDLAIYGTLASVEGLSAHEDFIGNRGGVIRDWYYRMSEITQRN